VNLNFFEWLRDSVRKSVLLGVSDAVEQIGVPDNEPEVSPTLAALLGDNTTTTTKPTKSRRKSTTTNSNSRKRLGKSLKDMNTASS
jgi:hypothetical protein